VATAQRQRAATLSTTEQSVLGLLLTYGEHSGYDLKRAAEAEGGYATVRTVAQERRPDKQVYRITEKGEEAFRRWLEEPVDERAGSRSPFLLKVFFGDHLSREALVAHVERRRAEAAKTLAEYREIEERIRDDDRSFYGYVTLRWGLAQSEAWIRWADEILLELAER
jgi:DNA-binding PadR family transcriptional regulator